MKLRATPEGPIAHDAGRYCWVRLPGEDDVLAFLREGAPARERAAAAIAAGDAVEADPSAAGLPFVPRSMRAFMLWESHVVRSSRMLVKHFFPAPVWRVVSASRRPAGRSPSSSRAKASTTTPPSTWPTTPWCSPTARTCGGRRTPRPWTSSWSSPASCAPRSSTPRPEEARAAVGGWFVLNDWSARDVQADDARHNVFGPVIKSKTFANSIGPDLVTADEFGDWKAATGRVRVDGESGARAPPRPRPRHRRDARLRLPGERLDAGDVVSTGTMPGCCGLELERWVKPGQTVELEIDRIGTVANRIAAGAAPTTAV